MRAPIWHYIRPDVAASLTHQAIAQRLNWGVIWQMTDINNRAVIAPPRVAVGQKITAALGSHMTQTDRCEFLEVDRKHAC
jgi:hypothetical protein